MPAKREVGVQLKITTYQPRKRSKTEIVTLLGNPVNTNTGTNTVAGSDVSAATAVSSSAAASDDIQIGTQTTTTSRQPYSHVKKEQAGIWRDMVASVVETGRKMAAPCSSTCSKCAVVTSSPINCKDCGPNYLFCDKCEAEVHEFVLHKPCIWMVILVKLLSTSFCFVFFSRPFPFVLVGFCYNF